MSLEELLKINEIVFGVEKPKVKAYYSYKTSIPASLSTYKSGLYIESNFENSFIYCGKGLFSFKFVLRIQSGTNFTYSNFSIISNTYLNYEDVKYAATIMNFQNIVGISFICAVPLCYTPQTNNVSVKDPDNKDVYKMQLYTLAQQTSGGQRVYLIEYDQTKIMKI